MHPPIDLNERPRWSETVYEFHIDGVGTRPTGRGVATKTLRTKHRISSPAFADTITRRRETVMAIAAVRDALAAEGLEVDVNQPLTGVWREATVSSV